MDCIFCRIIAKEIPAEIVFEDNNVCCFKDIHPAAEFHVLLVTKKHVPSVKTCSPEDLPLIYELINRARLLAEAHNLDGYKLHFNVGAAGGQIVPHVHLHLLGGKELNHNLG